KTSGRQDRYGFPVLFEREGEQVALASGGIVLLEGEAGVGKTAPLDWGASHAGGTGLRARGAALRREVGHGGARPRLRPPPRGDAFAILNALYWRLSGETLLVDDAHWAAPPSLRFLAFLARRYEGPLVIAYRAGEPLLELERVAAEPGVRLLRLRSLSRSGS